MAGYHQIKRLEQIIRIITESPNISKKMILERLSSEEIFIEGRTFERDIKCLRDEFQLEICYNRNTKGYLISDDNQPRLHEFFKFLELVHIGQLVKDGLTDFNDFIDKVDLDDSSQFKGMGQLKTILLAIQQKKQLKFKHQNFWNQTLKDYTITPLRIKEYLNRWYVVGVPESKNEIRTFGIDRLLKLKTFGRSTLNPSDFEKQLDQFNYVVGLNYSAGKAQKVVLRVYFKHLHYLESLPLHHSQKLHILPGEEYGTATYHLIPNYELKMQLMKMSEFVKVEEPKSLQKEIIQMLENTLAQYE